MVRQLLVLALLAAAACHHASHHNPADAGADDMVSAPDLAEGKIDPDTGGGIPDGFSLGANQPQVLLTTPGAVLSTPSVVAITYENDPFRADAEKFLTQYAASSAWPAQTSEYGVGALTVATPIHLGVDAPAALSDDEVKAMLIDHVTGTNPAWGPLDPQRTYQFYIPETVAFTQPGGAPCCSSYLGYHAQVDIGATSLSYEIVCECPSAPIEDLTSTASHEIVESVTDPYPYSRPGYAGPSDDYAIFTYVSVAGEVGDLCNGTYTGTYQPADMDYTISRSYSNAAAAAGHDPCVAEPTSPYFQTVPYLPDTLHPMAYAFGPERGLKVAVGHTHTVHFKVFSEDPSLDFTLKVVDINSLPQYARKPLLSFAAPPATVHAGDEVAIQVTVLDQDLEAFGHVQPFGVKTTPVNSTAAPTLYYGLIGQD